MTLMTSEPTSGDDRLAVRVERSLERCLEWSTLGRHRRVLAEVERLLPLVSQRGAIEAQLLIWKATALLAMGLAERALQAAQRSWELEESPHACHLMAAASSALGEDEHAEETLRMGWSVFPDAGHLPVQLAMILTEQGRLPEALDLLDSIPTLELPDELEVFLFSLKANLLASVGRPSDAEQLLREAVRRHPDAELLRDATQSLLEARRRSSAEAALITSWRSTLRPLSGGEGEVDLAIDRVAAVLEIPELLQLAARRLWRAFADAEAVRPQALEPWAIAVILAVVELDGLEPSAAAASRSLNVSPSTVNAALRRIRRWLGSLSPELAARSFAAATNPRLEERSTDSRRSPRRATVIRFPTPDASGGPR